MAEFDESKVSRDEKGRFSSGGLSAFAEKHAGSGEKEDNHGLKDKIAGIMRSAIASGKVKGTLEGHVTAAKVHLAKHEATYQRAMSSLKAAVGPGYEISGRVKDLNSAIEKVARKPESYNHVSDQQDSTGMRVIGKSLDDVRKAVEGIRATHNVVHEDNYIDKAKGDYRSHHMIVEDKQGLQREIQVRTGDQHKFAEWAHHAYKPETRGQVKALKTHKEHVDAYSKAASDYIHSRHEGKDPGSVPVPHPVVAKHFGKIEF